MIYYVVAVHEDAVGYEFDEGNAKRTLEDALEVRKVLESIKTRNRKIFKVTIKEIKE